MKKRPNFKIVENYSVDVDMDELAKDYLDKSVSVDDICEKYGISRNKYYILKRELVEMTGVEFKQTAWGGNPNRPSKIKNIYKRNNRYRIAKTIQNKTYYFGEYDNIEEAVYVRDIMEKHGWDKKYYEEHVKKQFFKSYNESFGVFFDSFKKDYLEGMTIPKLREKYELSAYRYYYLSALIREEMGLARKPTKVAS